MTNLKKKIRIQLEKYTNIVNVYFTPKNQMWAILSNGKKKCILKNIVYNLDLHNF